MQMHMLKVQPMVVPPLPWRSLESGGLLFTRLPVMRTRTAAQVQALQEAEAAAPDGLRRVSRSSSQCCRLMAGSCAGALCCRLSRARTRLRSPHPMWGCWWCHLKPCTMLQSVKSGACDRARSKGLP